VECCELETVLNVDVHSKLHVLYGGTKVIQHTPPTKNAPGLKGAQTVLYCYSLTALLRIIHPASQLDLQCSVN